MGESISEIFSVFRWFWLTGCWFWLIWGLFGRMVSRSYCRWQMVAFPTRFHCFSVKKMIARIVTGGRCLFIYTLSFVLFSLTFSHSISIPLGVYGEFLVCEYLYAFRLLLCVYCMCKVSVELPKWRSPFFLSLNVSVYVISPPYFVFCVFKMEKKNHEVSVCGICVKCVCVYCVSSLIFPVSVVYLRMWWWGVYVYNSVWVRIVCVCEYLCMDIFW